VNVYFGGINRFCQDQPNLTASWVTAVSRQGWRLLPTYVGYQPTCTLSNKIYRYSRSSYAVTRGTNDATDAVARAAALGIRPGSALYADIEHYDVNASGCAAMVRSYAGAWTKTLHAAGYLAGVYVHQNSGALHLSSSYALTTYARPDAIWMARYDGVASTTGWPTVPDAKWANHQRAKQYRGGHDETWGGVTVNVDSNVIDAPVATVRLPYTVTSSTPLNARSGPSATFGTVTTHAPGSTVQVVCQMWGQKVATTSVWDRLSDGTFVSDYYVSTPSQTWYSTPLPRCTSPGQVSASGGLTARTGPGTSYAASGAKLAYGALAYVTCQKAGTKVGTTSVWDRLEDGRWVSDYYVSNASNTTYSSRVARCA
jgi:uncharacterized protein YraI